MNKHFKTADLKPEHCHAHSTFWLVSASLAGCVTRAAPSPLAMGSTPWPQQRRK